jgi:hypothetical protein
MSQADKLVVYYSCFDYEIDLEDFSHIDSFKSEVSSWLSPSWSFQFEHELELLNIRYSKRSLELCSEVYLSLLVQSQTNTYYIFRQIFINELLLQSIFTPDNPEVAMLDSLLSQFYLAACQVPSPQLTNVFKLLPSCRKSPDLEALVVAEEAVMTLSQKICHVLKKASVPLENFVGPEITQKIANYLNGLSSRVLKTQQVTSSFVTNIVELKANGNSMKVRIIKPAQEFYDQVLETWKTCRDPGNSTCFLLDLRGKLGSDWNEKFVSPALCFFEMAREEWGKSKMVGYNFFLKKMQERLVDMWKMNIIETSKSFQEHMITKTVM